MNKYQMYRLNSFKLIVKESRNNPNSIAQVPKFESIINMLEAISNELEAHHVNQEKDLTGITTDKDVALENLIDFTGEIAGAVYSYAHDRGDNALMSKINYKSTTIEKMPQSKLIATAGIVLEEALKIPANELANEGISAEEMSNYQQSILHFKNVKSLNKEAIIDRSGTTEKINELFKEATTLLKNKLDRLAVQFKRKDPEFYLKFKAARAVRYRAAKKKVIEDGKNDSTEK